MRPGSADRIAALKSAADSFVDSARRASESRRGELERIATLQRIPVRSERKRTHFIEKLGEVRRIAAHALVIPRDGRFGR